MTIDQLKERVEAQCMKHGFEVRKLYIASIVNGSIYCTFKISKEFYFITAPDTELLLERVDWECRVLKAYQSRATNGIDI